jgi:hypothetical protein
VLLSFESAAPNARASVLSESVQTSYGNFSFSAHARFFSGVLNPRADDRHAEVLELLVVVAEPATSSVQPAVAAAG